MLLFVQETSILETIVKIHSKLTEIAIILGVSDSTTAKFLAILVPVLFLIFFILFLLKIIPENSKSNSKKDDSKTLIRGKNSTPFNPIPERANQEIPSRFAARQFSRVGINLKTNYTLPDEDNKSKDCALLNVSLSGLSFVCHQEIANGTRVHLQMPVLDETALDENFTVSGEILQVKLVNKLLDFKQQFEYRVRFFHLMKKESDYMDLIIQKFKS